MSDHVIETPEFRNEADDGRRQWQEFDIARKRLANGDIRFDIGGRRPGSRGQGVDDAPRAII